MMVSVIGVWKKKIMLNKRTPNQKMKIKHALVKGEVKQVFPKIFCVTVDDDYDRAMCFCRMQEFYEYIKPMVIQMIIGIGVWRMMTYFGDVI